MNFKVLCILISILFSGFCLSEEPVKYQFYRTAKAGDIEQIERLKRIYDINDIDGSGLEGPAFNIAVYKGDIGAVNILFSAGANIQIEWWNTGFPLHIVAKAGNIKMIRWLYSRGADANAVNRVGYSPIHSTALFGHVEAFMVLRELGADIHKKVERTGHSLLHLVALGNHPEFIEVLVLQLRMAIDMRNFLGYTPLHEAVRTDSFKSVEKLVKLGADIYASGKVFGYFTGVTPLDIAKKRDHADIKEFLTQVHEKHKQGGYVKALEYERKFMQVPHPERMSSFINSCRNLFRRFVLPK